MDRYDVRSLFDAVGAMADNVSAMQDNTADASVAVSTLHDLLDEGLSQLNHNLGRIADALELAREDSPR